MRSSFVILFLLFTLPLFSQEELPVKIVSIQWVLKNYEEAGGAGFTRETALYRAFRINEGDLYDNDKQLERRLQIGKKELESRQLYKYISVEVYYVERDGVLEASVFVYIVDRWNMVIFPRASYDTNLGMQYGGRIQYKNVLGSLVDLDILGYWSKDQWDITTEISNLDLLFFQGNFFYSQHFENVYRYDNEEVLETHFSFQTSEWKIKIDFPITPGLEYYIMPGILVTHSFDIYEDFTGLTLKDLEGEESFVAAAFQHGAIYDQIQWDGTMRSGYSLSLDNRFEIPLENEIPQIDLDWSINGYSHLENFMGFSASLSGFRTFNGIRNNAGLKLRGIQDNLVYGEWGLFLNTAVESRSIHLPPVVDIHLQPFLDWGYTVSPGEGLEEVDNFFMTGGFSLVIFPLPFKSLQISLILGYDLLEPSPYEFGIYTGLFF